VHGGAWASGDRLNNAPINEALAKSGIVVLALDFRMPPQHRYPASIADINYATRWLKAHANEFGSRRELVGGIATSSGAHQLLLSLLKPRDPRYAELPLAEAAGEDASLPYIVLCWPISDPLARYRMDVDRPRRGADPARSDCYRLSGLLVNPRTECRLQAKARAGHRVPAAVSYRTRQACCDR